MRFTCFYLPAVATMVLLPVGTLLAQESQTVGSPTAGTAADAAATPQIYPLYQDDSADDPVRDFCARVGYWNTKTTGSTEGHRLASTSPLQSARVADAPRRLEVCRRAILERDFDALARITELDSNLMHSVMMTSTPPLFYWQPSSLHLMLEIKAWRQHGLPACYTLDAGPNVHVLCLEEAFEQLKRRLEEFPEVCEVLVSRPGGPARLE